MKKTSKAPKKELASNGTENSNFGLAGSMEAKVAERDDAGGYRHSAAIKTVDRLKRPPNEEELATKLIDEISAEGFNITEFCDTYGLKREELGRLTGFSLRALAEWNAGKLPSQPAVRRLREIRRLLDALSELVKAKSISPWLHKKNATFDGMTPLQVIEVGEMDRLWAMVYAMAHGVPE